MKYVTVKQIKEAISEVKDNYEQASKDPICDLNKKTLYMIFTLLVRLEEKLEDIAVDNEKFDKQRKGK